MNAGGNTAMATREDSAPLGTDPNTLAREVLARARGLAQIHEKETGALEAAQVEVFMAMQEEKLAAVEAYQESMVALLAQREELAGALDPALRAALAETQIDFALLTQRNKEALARMQRCMARLADKICAMAKAEVRAASPVGYGQNGGSAPGALRTVATSKGEVV
ncbi:MAG TPA: hypothetical protein DDX54_00775 [Rhodospirillaceae bacterium]|jgi:phospholipase/lecithinase/hemolysin|nr:hypothetical protein [Alphaproteobacteria bacterium]HBH25928.1 hypothetical protein [Rhodospirillaceae bacterium]